MKGTICLVAVLGLLIVGCPSAMLLYGQKPPEPERVTLAPAAAQLPASNTDAVATLTAVSGGAYDIHSVRWSYTAAPAAGTKVIVAWTDAGSTARTESYYVSAGGPGQLLFSPPLTVAATVAPTVTAKAAGSGISGSVYVTFTRGVHK